MPDLSPVSGSGTATGPARVPPERSGPVRGEVREAPARRASLSGPRTAGERSPRLYLDHLASTPCDPEAAALMQRLAVELAANPSSPHRSGQEAARRVERAREQVADAIDALAEEIVFTSGATQSNNLAILGAVAFAEAQVQRLQSGVDRDVRAGERTIPSASEVPPLGTPASPPASGRKRLLTLGIEHPSVLAPMAELGRRGYEVDHIPVHPDGRVDLDALAAALARDDVLLLSIQAANNEIGTIQPLAEASRMATERGVLVHSDAAQILGKSRFSVEALHLDFASLSAHKAYGPKGVGALWIRGGAHRAPIRPLTFGGGHEHRLCPGTLNAPAIAAFGLAAELAIRRLAEDSARIGALRNRLEADLAKRLGDRVRINGAIGNRLPHATSLTFFDPEGRPLDADALVANLPEFDLSTASACHAGTPEPSHVLRATGMSAAEAYGTLRVGLGRGTGIETLCSVAALLGRLASAQGRGRLMEDTRTARGLGLAARVRPA